MAAERTWFGHPRGLTYLFLTNMWEQFSYYGMRALLVYYMTKQLLFAQGHASFVYGAYTASAYFTPIVGGQIADRWLGKRRAVVIGAGIMAAGHFMMTFDALFYVALATIALGNGLFLPSLPAQVGDLYARDDPRRASAFNVYYVGVNIGGLLAPLICGTLGEVYGWHYGFAAAGVGMLAGLVIYLSGRAWLPPEAPRVRSATPKAERGGFDRQTILMLAGVALSVTVFRGAYEQLGNTVPLWIDVGVDRAVGAYQIPLTWFLSLDPLFVMLLTPPLIAWWARRAAAGHDQPFARRMATGGLIVGAAYLLLAGVSFAQGGGRANWAWLVLFFLAFTIGELFILPTGLALFARLAPRGLGATTIAAWFLTIFTGSLSAGLVGTLWSHMAHPQFFLLLGAIAGVAALLLFLIDAPAQRTRHNVSMTTEIG